MIFDEKSAQLKRLLLVLDMCLTALVYLVSFWAYHFFIVRTASLYPSYLAFLPHIIILQGFFMSYFGAYNSFRISTLTFARIVFLAIAMNMAVLFAMLFLLKLQDVSRIIMLLFTGTTFLTLVVVRSLLVWWYFKRAVQKGENYLKVLIIGTGERAVRLSDTLRKSRDWGVHIIGHLDTDKAKVGSEVSGSPVLGTLDSIAEILESHVIDEVIMAIPRTMMSDVEEIANACEEEGVRFRLMADIYDLQLARMRLADLDGIPLLSFEPVAQNEAKLLVKRMFDLIVTLAAMPVLLPMMALIALAIKLDSPGPVFFIQQRVGLRKRLFPMYKFRTMVQDSEKLLKDLEARNEAEGPIFKMTNDPRVTRVGKFLRKTSLDEFPQLFNVIRGQMSLVGPRPMSIRDVNLFDKSIQRKRFSVKPGLTCVWQISGRSNLPFEKWLELDLYYIENWSLSMDIKILFKTIPAVLKGSGAV
ncbi:MAG: sugar transferase [Gammaproteobacteria bacterium]|nr:sugar transferase [Gammaproteobacteria bacterium]MDH5652377.1 sugar transferase [Gammaproteobacteria bacterium]